MPRRDGERTNEYLGRTLDDLGLHNMAERARLYHFDDYFCPDEVDDGANINHLVEELRMQRNAQRTLNPDNAIRINATMLLAMEGEFDGTKEESEEWAKSADGQETFRMLIEGE
jgi:hypothetical protein